jgi:single-strand DNA-binding protein
LNRASIIGRLGSDPELRYTQNNKAVANFSVATDESWTDRDHQRHQETEWHRIVVWGKQAESCEKYLGKGRLVYIEGPIRTRSWEDRDGNKRYTTEIRAQRIQFLDRGDDSRGGNRGSSSRQERFDDDDVGF